MGRDMHHRRGSNCEYCKARERHVAAMEDRDLRWRPMRTAPFDAQIIELRLNGKVTNGRWLRGTENAYVNMAGIEVDAAAWRPAHPEWNEEES